MKLRQRYPINYYEPQEPSFDDYVYCDHCADFVYEYCSIHGGLLVIPDEKVPAKSNFPSFVPRAALTIPKVFLHLAHSIIPGASIGVFTTLTLPRGVRFGPYRGRSTTDVESPYCWQLHEGDRRKKGVVDASDPNSSNWMRYVNCARHWCEQNLVAYQYQGQIYYRTIKIIPRFTELLLFYGGGFADLLDINLKKYDDPDFYSMIQGNTFRRSKIQRQPTEVLLFQDVTEIPKYDDKPKPDILQENLGNNNIEMENTENFVIIEEDTISHEGESLFHETQENDSNDSTPTVEYDEKNNTFNINFNNSSDNYYKEQDSNLTNTKNFLTSNILTNHMQTQHNTICQICNFKSVSRKNLLRHIRTVHRIKNEIKPKPNNNKVHNCHLCDKIYFNGKNSLTRHLKKYHLLNSMQCISCTFRTYSEIKLQRHMNENHNGLNIYECDKCCYKSSIKRYLKRHEQRAHKNGCKNTN